MDPYLTLKQCPHCSIDRPNLALYTSFETNCHDKMAPRIWGIYTCQRCGGAVTAWRTRQVMKSDIIRSGHFPGRAELSEDIPERARQYLRQAIDSVAAPVGSIMLCASAVDAMLKAKGFKAGSLYSRIDEATKEHVITAEMARWAHRVRLDANDQRHADELAPLPTVLEAKEAIRFTETLAEILFVLPAKISEGLGK